MSYIDNVKGILDGSVKSGNCIDHGFTEIVEKTRRHGSHQEQYVVMNNLYFLKMDESKKNWRSELTRFCETFDLTYSLPNSSIIEFRSKSSKGK